MALCNCRLGQWEAALQAFKKVHRLTPSDAQTLWLLVRMSDALGRGAGALAILDSVTCGNYSEAGIVAHFCATFAVHSKSSLPTRIAHADNRS